MARYFKHALLAGMIVSVAIAPSSLQAVAEEKPATYTQLLHKSLQDGFYKAILELTTDITKKGAYFLAAQVHNLIERDQVHTVWLKKGHTLSATLIAKIKAHLRALKSKIS